MSLVTDMLRDLLRALLSSKLIHNPVQRLLLLWAFLRRRLRAYVFDKRRPPRGGTKPKSGAGGGGSVVNENDRDSQVLIYCSNEPISASNSLGFNIAEPSPGLLSATPIEDLSRPVSVAGAYSISVQTASQTSLPTNNSWNDQFQHHRDPIDHLGIPSRPSSRASSAASSRVGVRDRGTSRFVTGSSRRAASRSRSQAPSSIRTRHSRLSHVSVVPSGSDPSNRALPSGNTPAQSPVRKERKLQEVQPVTEVERYGKGPLYKKDFVDYVVKPLERMYELTGVPHGWIACTHPEGALYFYHPTKRIYTDAYLCSPIILSDIEDFISVLGDMVDTIGSPLPPNHELVLDLQQDKASPGQHQWCYYYVDSETRTLFWLQDYDVTYGFPHGVKGINSPTLIKHGIERQYWLHVEMFPHMHMLTDNIFRELTSIVIHHYVDQLTSQSSTVTYTVDELDKMLTAVQSAKELGSNDHTACIVGRLMSLFALHRLVHYHGQEAARLDWEQSLFENIPKRTPLITVLSPLLFNAPEVHLIALEKIWVDDIITIIPWSQFMDRLQTDWQEYVLFATVMLNANISFMTINDVDPGTGSRTPAQIASLVSTIASIGSTFVGLLLVRQYRLKPKDTAQEAVTFLNSRKHPTLGLETLAIVYSLPYALLIWGMVTFLIAFAFECFVKHDDTSTIVSAVAWFLVGLLIIWTIYTAWEGGEISIQATIREIWDRACSRLAISAKPMLVLRKAVMPRLHQTSTNTLPATPEVREMSEC
ncbi:hypothetical protein WOLCODRAFT_125636 [Wolfiporia cocos MD-104 SS10]|uniref:WW domain-containing protein n=1 Tax=Wolfiporia cocos (strain MD-104) TaxID=742152 RepID=A0A2H3JGV5_WOLCO|nr:hypothetical protein WOLCODRAFT_125636 [Wolfiporia cocos MD-104 SS10]